MSVVVPAQNSTGSLPEPVKRLGAVLPTLAPRFEVIIVNDGSGIDRVEVVTQARNVHALRVYQRGGVVTKSTELSYHKWYREVAFGPHGHRDSLQPLVRRRPRARISMRWKCAGCFEIAPGDEVIVPSFTFVSTVNAFVLRGARPVFADIRADTLNIDELKREPLITSRTKAIIVVHHAGVGCEMDASQPSPAGMESRSSKTTRMGFSGNIMHGGSAPFGQLVTQGFHETKNITCREGGALLLNEARAILPRSDR